jgi:hypothetical protein
MLTYYIFFLRIYSADHLRYILPVYLLLTWHAGKFAADLVDYAKIPKSISSAAIILILVHSLVYGFSLDLLLTRDSRYSAEKWMAENIPQGSVVMAHGAGNSLPRFPAGLEVKRMKSGGGINADMGSLGADYLVLNLSLSKRLTRSEIYQFLYDRGFSPVAAFKSPIPIFGAELFNAVNPEIVIFRRLAA